MGAPTFSNGLTRGMTEMVVSVVTGIIFQTILDASKLLPETVLGGWAAIFIYLLTVLGVLELLETLLKSEYWNDEYLVGYMGGVILSAIIVKAAGLVPDITLLLLVAVLMVSFAYRLDRRRVRLERWERW